MGISFLALLVSGLYSTGVTDQLDRIWKERVVYWSGKHEKSVRIVSASAENETSRFLNVKSVIATPDCLVPILLYVIDHFSTLLPWGWRQQVPNKMLPVNYTVSHPSTAWKYNRVIYVNKQPSVWLFVFPGLTIPLTCALSSVTQSVNLTRIIIKRVCVCVLHNVSYLFAEDVCQYMCWYVQLYLLLLCACTCVCVCGGGRGVIKSGAAQRTALTTLLVYIYQR
jgi:hypothetical protein